MHTDAEDRIALGTVLIIARFLVSYVKYLFLTGSVIFSLTVLVFIILNIHPDFSLGFLQYFSFIDPAYKTGSFHMGTQEVMEIFLVISLVLWVVATLIKFLLKKIFGFEATLPPKSRWRIFFAAISVAYIFAAIIIALSDALDSGFCTIFFVLYIINLIAVKGYFLLDALSRKISQIYQKKIQA